MTTINVIPVKKLFYIIFLYNIYCIPVKIHTLVVVLLILIFFMKKTLFYIINIVGLVIYSLDICSTYIYYK